MKKIDKMFDSASIDKIFVKLFKKANDFEICIEHFKRIFYLLPES